METVSSKELLKRFLFESKDFRQLMTRDRFHSIVHLCCRNRLSTEKENQLYNMLLRQKEQTMDSVEGHIDRLELDSTGELNEDTVVELGDSSLEQLIYSLDALNTSLEAQIQSVEEQSKQELEEINEQIDTLNDLRYGKINFSSSIDSLYSELHQLETQLLEMGR
ncbi:hypothetical protein OGAPHI_004329 [Ogataea philodendri]|uniref:Uncharacterized protein n=1 Tax=Ogataea philodendri TaxID=1378263 RepID=A0A9P8T5I5_9ASCO|nr:uncharacterized protein OGAPHI_004329 [Ogataea philodendri]KAH3666140.1 hypothetical protein OGAPHI_004329 [Ogataea philodendri]